MVLPLIVRAAPFLARGAAALKKGKKLKDLNMNDVTDAPILRITKQIEKAKGQGGPVRDIAKEGAAAVKKSKGSIGAARAEAAAGAAATGAAAASALKDTSEAKPKAEAKGRRGGVAPSGSTARENAAPKITPKVAPKVAAPKAEKKMLGGREVKNNKVFVSKAELDAFKKKNGADKTLRDFLNAERGLTRRDAPAKKAKASERPLKTLETQADVDKRRAKQKALQEKALRETGRGK
jgi:hypothetical protein